MIEALMHKLEMIAAEVSALRALSERENWPKTVEQFAAYVSRDVRTVQGWISAGKLRARADVRPALITRSQAALFLEGRR